MLEVALTRHDGQIYAVLAARAANGDYFQLITPPDIPSKGSVYESVSRARLALIRTASKDQDLMVKPLRKNGSWQMFPAEKPSENHFFVLDKNGHVEKAVEITPCGDILLENGKRIIHSSSFWWSYTL